MSFTRISPDAMIRWIKLHPIPLVFTLSFIPAYSSYIYLLQPSSTSLSKTSLVLAGLIWAGCFFLIWFLRKGLAPQRLFAGHNPSGITGVLFLANLFLLLAHLAVPYPYFLIPTQSVTIQAVSPDKSIQILSFASENQESIDLPQFTETAGWQVENRRITHVQGEQHELVWQGKPGQFIEIQFSGCGECSKVRIFGQDFAAQEIDLSQSNGDNPFTFRHEYPSLVFLKWFNLLVLEGTLFLIASLLIQLLGLIFARLQNRAQSTRPGSRNVGGHFPILALAALTVVTYALKIKPVLFNDDWCQIIGTLNLNTLQPFMLDARRPLHLFLAWLVGQFFPLDQAVFAILAVQILVLFVSAVLTYTLVCQLFNGRKWFALLVAALWLVFPNDYTYLYISVLGIRFAYLLILVVMLLILRLIKTGSLLAGLGASILIILSLLMYEGQLGILMVWPFLLIARYWPQLSWRKILGLGEYYLAITIFVAWRLVFQAGLYQDSKLGLLSSPTSDLLPRYFDAFQTILGGFKFPYPDGSWLSTENWVILGLLLLCWAAIFAVSRRLSQSNTPQAGVDPTLPTQLSILAGGFILWSAGYFPILLNYPPNIYGHLSRVNLFSNLGGAFLLLTLIDMISSSLSRSKSLATGFTSLVAVVLIGFGAVVQLQVQESYDRSWTETTAFYQALFEKVPNVTPNTQIVVLLSGYEQMVPSRRTPFTTGWEATCALQTLYNRADLTVNYRYGPIKNPSIQTFGILSGIMYADTLAPITNPGQLVVVHYNGDNQTVDIERDVSKLLDPSALGVYNPEQRILPLTSPISTRKLVQ